MNFQLKHRGIEVSESLEDSITEKVMRFEKLVPEATFTEMTLVDHPNHHDGQKEAEIIVDIPGKKTVIRYVGNGETFLAAVDDALDKLDDALSQLKEKDSDYSYKGQSPKEWLADELTKEAP